MGLIVGLDFGTTYSMLSEKDHNSGNIVPCKYENENMIEDSLVFIGEDGTMKFGKDARNSIMSRGVLYAGFKMLLTEKRPQALLSEHYTEKITPYDVTKEYLKEILRKCRSEHGVTRIERLVVGVPDVWDKKANKEERNNPLYANRTALEKVIRDLNCVDDFELHSEPELASAYYLEHYKQANNGKAFSGHLLLIDYGGGTLDVAICKFDPSNNRTAGVLKTFGEGWNEQGKKGDAGLAYMRAVIDLALESSGLEPNERKIRTCVYSLENKLLHMNGEKTRELESVFQNGRIESIANSTEYEDEPFEIIAYDFDNDLIVTYKHLAQAFVKIIEPVLKRKEDVVEDGKPLRKGVLIRAKEYMVEHDIDYRVSSDNANFKIQLVGGFSNFYLVQQAVGEVFGRSDNDARFAGGFADRSARSYAVSFGAALVANRDITITKQAYYSLGIYGFENYVGRRVEIPYFAINIGELIVPGKIYMVNLSNGEPKIFHGKNIEYFCYCDDPPKIQAYKAKEDYMEHLQFGDTNSPYVFGMSFNKSLAITIFKWKVLDRRSFLLKYQEYTGNKKNSKSFGNLLYDTPEKFAVEFESSVSLADIFTLSGTSST